MTILTTRDCVEYALLDADDLAPAADVIARGFTDGSEPTALALGLGQEDFKPFVEALLPKFLEEGLSIVARDTITREIVGAELNEGLGLDFPVEPNQFDWVAPVLALATDLYGRYFQGAPPAPGESVHLFMIGVSEWHRGKGIAQQLLGLSLERARSRGYRRAVAEDSGIISKHILRRAGFTSRVEIHYATFEYEGKQTFKNTGDHPSIILMDKDL